MAIDPNAYLNKKHTGWFTGKEGNKGYAYWNPETESYVRQTEADYNKQAMEHRDTQGGRLTQSYINKFGDSVFGLKPTDTHKGVINGEEVNYAGKNPYAGMWTTPDTGTSVPGSPVRNPDFVMPDSRFQEDTRGPQISYGQHGKTPAERQGLFNQAFANNPELVQSPEFAQALENSGLLTDLVPQAPQAPQMSGQEAFDFARDYANRFHAGKGDEEQHQANKDEARAFSQDSSLLQALGDHAIETKTGVQEFLNTARSLHMYNPEAFEEWELKNPEMAVRYHARAAAGNGNVGGIKGYDHAGRAQALSYGISQQLGYGEDGKKDGKAIAYNFDTFNDLQSENGDGDFWKLGTPNTFTDDLSDFIEDNPLAIAGVAASIAAPWAAPALAGALGVSNAVASGIISAGASALQGGDFKDILTQGLISWGIPAGSAKMTEVLGSMAGSAPQAGDALGLVGDAVETGGELGGGLFESIGNGTGVLGGIGDLNNIHDDWENDQPQGNSSNSELQRPTGPESTWDRPWIGNTPVADVEGRDWVYGPTDRQEDPHWHTVPKTGEESGGGGGGSQSGSGGPAAPTGGNSEGGGTGAQDGSGDTPWVYEGEGVFRNENTGATRTETEYEGAVVGDNYGFGDDPLDNNPTPPTPNDSLPNGYEWVMTQGTWTLKGPNGETISQQELAEQIYGSLVTGTGTTGGNGGGLPGGGDLGTGIDNTIGTGGGSGTGGGTGTGSGGGDGDGEGEGEGDGEGSGTPLADGLMASLGGTNVPTGLVDIPQVAPIQTRPLDWSFLRKVSEGRG
tara:strand:- start:14103 stop:16481 length:2379 start_codon:yes stop_codon:yes gene_type:complete